MIKANELAIGRLFYFDGKIVEVMGYLQDDDSIGTVIVYIESVSVPNERRKPINLEKLNPIPIDPELLERCGFVKEEKDGNNVGIEKYYVFTNAPFVYNSIHGYWLHGRHMNVQPKYLHQLQNLYFALTGEELTIKN